MSTIFVTMATTSSSSCVVAEPCDETDNCRWNCTTTSRAAEWPDGGKGEERQPADHKLEGDLGRVDQEDSGRARLKR